MDDAGRVSDDKTAAGLQEANDGHWTTSVSSADV